ncbi:MAG TPA: VWA domain-containing protein [Pyrinomonadaceae bacterium]|nr:VWA domain-containing protein [Pyrinomonadaceae bacterium]
MRVTARLLFGALLLSWALAAGAAAQEVDPDEKVTVETDLVLLRVTVSDRQGRAVAGLRQGDFKAFEDGVEQPVSFFSAEESPVSWGLVLDRSGSMEGMMGEVYSAALHVIEEGTEHDEMFIVTFNSRPEVESEFTSDRHRLENSTLGLRAESETALYDAVSFALDKVKQGRHRKKALVVVTDGEDNASRMKFRELVERAEEEDVLVYTVGMFESSGSMRLMGGGGDARAELKKLAEVTGASAHFPGGVEECRKVMREIAREVSQQYSVGYYPANKAHDGKWRGVRVVAGEQTKYVARARTGYYAKGGAPRQ